MTQEPQQQEPVRLVNRSSRLQLLDILRGLSALAVVVYHGTMHHHDVHAKVADNPHTATLIDWLLYVAQEGYLGVPIFFMISGYCIYAAAVNHRQHGHPISRYFRRRFFRIYPPYWTCLLLLLVLSPIAAFELHPERLTATQWLGNLFLFELWRPYVLPPAEIYNLNGVAWTLCYEEQFYLAIGLTLWLRPQWLFPMFLLATAFAVFNNYNMNLGPLRSFDLNAWKTDVGPLIILDSYWMFFASGISLYVFRMSRSRLVWIIPLVFAALIFWELRQGDWHTNRYMTRVTTFGMTLLLCFLQRYDRQIAFSRLGLPLQWLGLRTYSIYLVHLPLVLAVINTAKHLGYGGTWTALLVILPINIVVSLVAGELFYRFVERRFIPASGAS